MMPVISMYEMQSQFGKVEKGRLYESLLYACTNFPGYLFTVMMSQVGVVTPTNEAMPKVPYRRKLSRKKTFTDW